MPELNDTKSLTVELNDLIKMFMSYSMNKHEAKKCVLELVYSLYR